MDCLLFWMTGWWFGTFFIFPYIVDSNPNWLIFFRGVGQPAIRWSVWNQRFLRRVKKMDEICGLRHGHSRDKLKSRIVSPYGMVGFIHGGWEHVWWFFRILDDIYLGKNGWTLFGWPMWLATMDGTLNLFFKIKFDDFEWNLILGSTQLWIFGLIRNVSGCVLKLCLMFFHDFW